MSWPNVKPPWEHVKWLSWGLPDVNKWNYPPMPIYTEELDTSVSVNVGLQELKLKIEELDNTNEWEFLKRSSNPYELVFSQSQDSRIPPSISSLRPLSRSFFKMIEILGVLDFFKRHKSSIKKNTIRSSHVCEGPGGFIEALLYLSKKNKFTVENSCAMTLKPNKTNIPGWKRAYHFLRKSPMVHIEYGQDDTGDIMVPANQIAFLTKTHGKSHIFTADGGFDFSEHYGTQEDEVFPLLVSSSIIGLQTMVKGGDFVLKVFDTELKSTQDLLAILAYCFDEWTLYKPALSRPCNAEKYFLGRGCRFVPTWVINLLSELRNACKNKSGHLKSIFQSIPENIENDLSTLKKEYLDQQVAALNYAISHKEEWNSNPNCIWKLIHENSLSWCQHFQMPIKTVYLL
jgi:23S rRNA U2552 (ribose-2'-O)-methylase RlmE/FtsJ